LQDQFWRGVGVNIERKEETSSDAVKPVTSSEPGLNTMLGVNTQRNREWQGLSTGSGQDKQQVNKERLTGQISDVMKPGQTPDIYEQMKIQLGKPVANEQMGDGSKTSAFKSDSQKVDANETKRSKTGAGVTPEEFAKSYKSFAAYSDDKFNQYIRAAEGFMKQGRFYRAADTYTIASLYKPNDPLGYAGKSVALFGSGEYLSSSLFLARALEIFPEYAKVRIDLVGMIGDKDTVENRILEARDWMDKSGSGELEFLLSYIYYQMDRMEFARQSIEAAAKKMPNSPAVAAMKKVIDERLAKP
jgi:tetratricopeptide (TPR) repeat protein